MPAPCASTLPTNIHLLRHKVSVKHTFIDEGIFDDDFADTGGMRRQCSAPATPVSTNDADCRSLYVPQEMVPPFELFKADSEKDSEPEKEAEPSVEDLRNAAWQQRELQAQMHNAATLPAMQQFGLNPGAPEYHPFHSQCSQAVESTVEPQGYQMPQMYPVPEMMPVSNPGWGGMPSVMAAPAETPTAVYLQPNASAELAANALSAMRPVTRFFGECRHDYTIMLRNLPNKVDQKALLEELDEAGFANSFDFLYLPIDPQTRGNLGYAFINFISTEWSKKFKEQADGCQLGKFKSRKVMSIVPAAIQGYDANYKHYSRSHVMAGEPSARPLFLREQKETASTATGSDTEISQEKPEQVSTTSSEPDSEETPQKAMVLAAEKKDEPCSAKVLVPKFCTSCGGAFRADFKFCVYCGAAIIHKAP